MPKNYRGNVSPSHWQQKKTTLPPPVVVTPPPTQQPSQRFDALPDYTSLFWQQLRPAPVPLTFLPPPPLIYPAKSQRVDALPDLNFVPWTRSPGGIILPAVVADAPLPRQASQRLDPLPDLDRQWWMQPTPKQTRDCVYLVQQASTFFASSAAARTLAFSQPVTIGDALFVAIFTSSGSNNQTVAITDTLGNTWAQVDDYRNANGGDTRFRLSVWGCIAKSTGACTITSAPSASLSQILAVLEYSGAQSPIFIDGAIGQDGSSSTSWTTTTIPVNGAHETVIGFFGCDSDKHASFAAAGGFIAQVNLAGNGIGTNSLSIEDKGAVSASVAATATVSGARGFAAIGVSLFCDPPPAAPPLQQRSQRFNPLPVLDSLWWQQLRLVPIPIGFTPAVDSPLPRQASQRFDPLLDFNTWWEQFRLEPLPITFIPPAPPLRLPSQRLDPLPNLVYSWWEQVYSRILPVSIRRPSHVKSFLSRVPSDDRRLTRFTEILSALVNSMVGAGYFRQTGPEAWTLLGGAFTAARSPGLTDDAAAGFSPGNAWVNTASGKVYFCISSAIGAATWNGPF